MYPYIRLAKEFIRHRNAPKLGIFGEHRATHICWPWDIDPFLELNNGRTLTLYDLGRFVLFRRIGAIAVMKENRWAGTVAGASIRYRRRVRAFQRYELRTRMVGWDDRFFYIEQSMWRNGECTSHGLLRTATTDAQGIVPTSDVARAFGSSPKSPPLPGWVAAWAAADAERPWPPMQEPPSGPAEPGAPGATGFETPPKVMPGITAPSAAPVTPPAVADVPDQAPAKASAKAG